MTKEKLAQWITDWLKDNVDLNQSQPDTEKTFVGLGVDSIHAMMLVGDLEELLSVRLSPTLAWDHPTIDALAGHLAQSAAAGTDLAGTPDAERAKALENIDQLSEAEIDRLLKKRLGPSETP